MGLSLEELAKSDRDQELEKKYKHTRMLLKLSLSKYINETPAIGKAIDGFAGQDPLDKKKDSAKSSFLDDLVDVAKFMDDCFNKLGDAAEGILVHKLTTVSSIYMERIGQFCREAKFNRFPLYKEKFAVNVTEEQEAKSVVPVMAFRSIKMFIDKYYFLARLCSVNPKTKTVFNKLSLFRNNMLAFEWNIGHYMGKLRGDYAKEVAPFYRDIKLSLLRIRKFCEAIESSSFGSIVKLLRDTATIHGARAYIKDNPVVTVYQGTIKGSAIPIGSILDKYDKFMAPIRQTVADYDKAKRALARRSPNEKVKMFWDISDAIIEFHEGMLNIIEEFSKGISRSNEDFKFFIYTVQNVLIPYMNQSKGEVNESFVVGVANLDTFFWKVMIQAIECGQEDGENIDEIVGLSIRVRKSDMDAKKAAILAAGQPEPETEEQLPE